jgi:hypothetical protein
MKGCLIDLAEVPGFLGALLLGVILLLIPTRLIFGDTDILDPRIQVPVLGIHIVLSVAAVSAVMASVGKSQLAKAGWPVVHFIGEGPLATEEPQPDS